MLNQTKLISDFILPDFFVVFTSIISILSDKMGWLDIWSTLYKSFVGLTFAIIFAIPTGLLLGHYKKIYCTVEILIEFFRSLPIISLFPLSLIIFGIGDTAKMAMAFFFAFWVILVNTIDGFDKVSICMHHVGEVSGANSLEILYRIILPGILPQLCIGSRIALSQIIVIIIMTEMFAGTTNGLGQELFDSYTTYFIPRMYAFILIIGCVGYILNRIFILAEKRFVHWSGK